MRRWEAYHKIYGGINKIGVDLVESPRRLLLHDIDGIVNSGDTFSKKAKRMLASARDVNSGPFAA
jgi:hypothetical protein